MNDGALYRMVCDSVTHEQVGAYLEDGTDYEGPTDPITPMCNAWHPDLVSYEKVKATLVAKVPGTDDQWVKCKPAEATAWVVSKKGRRRDGI